MTHRHASARAARPYALLLLVGLVAGSLAVASAREVDEPLRVSRQSQVTPTETEGPYLPPLGMWQPLHGPQSDPLWSTPPALRGVHGRLGDDGKWIGWAVGDEGAIARFDGDTWSKIDDFNPRSTTPIAYSFADVFVQAPDSVWIVGTAAGERGCEECGVIVHWDGRRFVTLPRLSYGVNGRMGGLNAIDMLQDADGDWWGWIVGDDAPDDRFKAMFIRYTPEDEWRVWAVSNIARDLYAVKMMASDEAWAVGWGGIETWYNERDDPGKGIWRSPGLSGADNLYAVDLPDPLRGWSAGARGRMNKYHGHCHDNDDTTQCWFDNQAIPVYNEDGRPWNFTIYGLTLISRTEGWLVGAVNGRRSTVAKYVAPKRWELVRLDDDPGKDLYAMVMLTPDYGWAVGDDGVILEYATVATRTPPAPDTPSVTPLPPGTTAAPSPSPSPSPSPFPSSMVTSAASPTDGPTVTVTESPSGTSTATTTPATPDGTDMSTSTASPISTFPATGTAATATPVTPTRAAPTGNLYLPALGRSW